MDKATQLRDFLASNNITPQDLAKATNDYAGLSGIKIIEDLWDDIHRIPTAKETTTGPSMSSSSPGVDAAMRNYSNPAPQVGITKEYEALSGHVATWEDLRSVAKSIGNELITAVRAELRKGEMEEEKKSVAKDADPDADADPGKSIAKDADPDADPARKSHTLTTLYTRLAKAEEEAADVEHKKEHDKEHMHEAKAQIAKAESYIEQLEVAKSEGARQLAALRAESSIGKAFEALMKARPIERHGLKGDGNQSDTAIPGSVREAEAKAKYWVQKVAHMKGEIAKDADPDADPDPGKSIAKDADPDPDSDPGKAAKKDDDPGKAMYCARFHGEGQQVKAAAEHFLAAASGSADPINAGAHKAVKDALRRYAGYLGKAEEKKDPDPDPDPDPGKSIAKDADPDADPGKKSVAKDADPDPDSDPGKSIAKDADPDSDPAQKAFNRAVQERIGLIERNMAANNNRPMITPVILQKSGITTETLAERMHNDVERWLDEGHLTDEDAVIADNIIDRFRAVGKGNAGITVNIVSEQLGMAPIPVRTFFEQYNNLPN